MFHFGWFGTKYNRLTKTDSLFDQRADFGGMRMFRLRHPCRSGMGRHGMTILFCQFRPNSARNFFGLSTQHKLETVMAKGTIDCTQVANKHENAPKEAI